MAIKKLVMDFETTKGIDPTSPKPIYIKPTGETGISVTRQTKSDDVLGDIDSGSQIYGTFNEVSGTTNIPMTYESIGYVFKAMFGNPTTVAAGSEYKHTFTSTIEELPTFLFQETGLDGATEQIDRYNGLMAKSIGLNVSPSGDYNVAFGYVGMSHKDSITDGISELSESNKIVPSFTRIKNEHASLLIDGTSFAVAKDFSFTYDRNTVAEPLIGSGLTAGDVYAQNASASGSISTLFDTSVYTKAKNETTLGMTVRYTDGTNILDLVIGEAKLSFKRESKKLGEKYAINADYTAFKEAGSELIKIELTNSVASY